MVNKVQPSWQRDLRVYWHCLHLQVRSTMSLRGAFALQIFGMVVNNTTLIIAWLFFFYQFGTVNGWQAKELIAVMGINMLVFGIVMLFSVGILDLPRHVDRGSLDGILTKPSPLILQLAGGNIDATTFGDTLLGLGIVAWYMSITDINIAKLAVFFVAIFAALIIFWCFAILLPSLLAFYIFDGERISRYLGSIFIDSGVYPTGLLTGPLRTFLMIVIPGLLMGAVPLEVLYRFGWKEAFLGVFVAVFWLAVSLWAFRHSIRRYESSNLIGAR